MDMCAYWTVKGHSSGDMLIQPRIHEYLADGNEGIFALLHENVWAP